MMGHVEASGRYGWSGYLLGFGLGGFFDGILLHQILQWHHLLSTINGQDIRFQVAADGYFHAVMYVIAGLGLWMLWTSRHAPDRRGRLLVANMLIGFGAWHVVDGIASHWVLGIHRIRMDSANPLFWDLLWFGIFGILPLALGWLMRRRNGQGDGMRIPRSSAAIRSLAALVVIGAGALALRPPQDSEFTTVLFLPGTPQERIMGAVDSVGGRLVWSDASGELLVVRVEEGQSRLKLFRQGAILVSGSGFPAGCFDYLRT